jgi:two-component system sensor histidine kinase RegB
LRIVDDGPGYPPQLIGRIGDPFVRQRSATKPSENRPGYEGMGLGLFIAKTLLERSDAEISFANGYESSLSKRVKGEKSGAIVEVIWPRGKTNSPFQGDVGPLGLNEPIEA